ncbi:MAG TPA: hypothetical protein VFN87_07520 [Solirubrobacteraceae bacterium]|nr:hypothetical protein [Solirubrobacteraceae bacterium]
MRRGLLGALGATAALAVAGTAVPASGTAVSASSTTRAREAAHPWSARPAACPHWGRPAIAADPRPHALRVFAIQFEQRPAAMVSAAAYRRAIGCALAREVLPHLARGRPNLVVFDEDVGLETMAIGPRGAAARALLRSRRYGCGATSLCPTLTTLNAIDTGYRRALRYLQPRFPGLGAEIGRGFVAATDEFVRVFMTTMAQAALRYRIYVIASNTQAPFRLTRSRAAVAALADPGARGIRAVYAPTRGRALDQTFVWGPRVVRRHAPPPLANLLADNVKVPLTGFEQALGFAAGPARGVAARRNLRPVPIPGTGARLGIATSLPAFTYGPAGARSACADVAVTYMRCLDRLGANVVIQADANNGPWTGGDGSDPAEHWQPLSWMGSAYRAVSDPTVHFAYAVNPFMVGNLADTPFDGQSAILERGRRGRGCHYVGNAAFVTGEDQPANRAYAGAKPQFLALAPWVVPDAPRPVLRTLGATLANPYLSSEDYVQTALIADLPFPVDSSRRGCVAAGR